MSPENLAILLTIAGAILGCGIPHIVKFFQFLIGLLVRKEILAGTWHAYHFTRMHGGKSFLRYESWRIRRNLQNQLVIKTDDPTNPDLKYKGTISVERNYLLILLKGVKHKEEVQMRFFDVIPTGQDIAFGLAMGVDFDNEPICVVRIMSRKKLSDEEATRILTSKTKMIENIFTISKLSPAS